MMIPYLRGLKHQKSEKIAFLHYDLKPQESNCLKLKYGNCTYPLARGSILPTWLRRSMASHIFSPKRIYLHTQFPLI